jgi:hypothetical protein
MEVIATCSLAAQGLWKRMEMIMHTSERYGYLQHLGKPMPDIMVARRIGVSLDEYNAVLKELDEIGWIVREKKSLIIYSELLVKQEEKRSGNRERKHNERENKKRNGEKTEQLRDDYEAITNGFEKDLDFDQNEADDSPYIDKSLISQNNGHNNVTPAVTAQSRACPGNGNGEGNGNGLSISSLPEKPNSLEALRATAESFAEEQVRKRNAAEPEPDPVPSEELIEEIALASPAAAANGWTALSIHGKSMVLNPVVNAVILEAKEQNVTEREAALYLLGQVRRVTEAVMREPGWKRFWTANRMVKFYEAVEYRDLEKFQAFASGGRDAGKPARSSGNGDAIQRAVQARRARAGGEDLSDRDGAGDAGSGLRQGSVTGDGGVVPGRSGGPGTPGTGDRVQPRGEGGRVHAFPGVSSAAQWPR